jgi:hypothetical protein
MNFNDYVLIERNLIESLLILEYGDAIILNQDDKEMISEATRFSKVLDKIGLELEKGTGLFAHLKNASVGIVKLLVAAIKGDRARVKEIASELKKEDVIDFFMKLDVVTLGIISTPLDIINGVTGWGIKIKSVKKVGQDLKNAIIQVIQKLKEKIKRRFMEDPVAGVIKKDEQPVLGSTVGKTKEQIFTKYLTDIERTV